MKYQIGDSKKVGKSGYVQLVDVMGSEDRIVQIARISRGEDYVKSDEATKRMFIRNLIRWGHDSPLEFAELLFKVKVPMDVWRQWVRHRTASIMERSTRYTDAIPEAEGYSSDEFYELKNQNDKERMANVYDDAIFGSYCDYREMVKYGVKKERARRVLPLCTYTEAYWKIDLRNLLHFIDLRTGDGAQEEIHEYATTISNFVKYQFPNVWEAYLDYRINSVTFSSREAVELFSSFVTEQAIENSVSLLEAQVKAGLYTKQEFESYKKKIAKMNDLFNYAHTVHGEPIDDDEDDKDDDD